MSRARHLRFTVFDGDGYRTHHTDNVVKGRVPTNNAGSLSALKQSAPFSRYCNTAGGPVLDDGPQGSGKALIDARVHREILKKPSHGVSGIMVHISRSACLRDRREPLVAGGRQKRFSRWEAAIESADSDLGLLGDLLQRNPRTSLQKQSLSRDENALTVPFRVGA